MRALRKIIALSAIILPLAVMAVQEEDSEVMQIDSGLANYDGKKLTLTGNVVVEHELGTLSAAHVVLYPDPSEKKLRFGYLAMKDQVKIALRDGGILTCHAADLDYKAMTGKFKSQGEEDFVVYKEDCKDRRDNQIPLEVRGRQMTMQIARDEGAQSPKSQIAHILAQKNVAVEYNQDFIARADQGEYQRFPADEQADPAAHFPGLITLSMNKPEDKCSVENRSGDHIKATRISIDTRKRQICFDASAGAIKAAQGDGDLKNVEFAADTVVWDDARDALILKENVKVDQKGIGRILTDKEITIYHTSAKGKKQLKAIECNGQTIMTHTDEAKDLCHTLISSGTVYVDHEKLETIVESPVDEHGKVLEGKQVFFHDYLGEVQADKMKITYKLDGHEIVPVKLILQGNVRILDRKAEHPDEEAPILHYALADGVIYDPQTKEMYFKAFKKKRVLFYDRVNNLQVSAPALKIKRDDATKKESVQGMGDVRFSFVESEFEQLRKRFSLNLEEPDAKKNK